MFVHISHGPPRLRFAIARGTDEVSLALNFCSGLTMLQVTVGIYILLEYVGRGRPHIHLTVNVTNTTQTRQAVIEDLGDAIIMRSL